MRVVAARNFYMKNFFSKFFGAIAGVMKSILTIYNSFISHMVIATGGCKNFYQNSQKYVKNAIF